MGLSGHLDDEPLQETPLPRRRRRVVWPPPVRPGGRIGVAALSGPVIPERLDRGLGALRDLGFEPVEAANLRAREALFAGHDRARLAAFHALVDDPSIEAIVFARGGHGVLRLLPYINWRLLKARPRAYVGYSDLTPFLTEIVCRLGLVAFHGPMVAADLARGLEPSEAESFTHALGGRPIRSLPIAGGRARNGDTGVIEGRVIGGCLSMLEAVLGSRHAPDLRDSILVVEEIDEPLYRLDRMLTHLRLSGTLTGVRALVFGHVTITGTVRAAADWRQLRARVEADFDLPLAWGLPIGHQATNLTLPLGAIGRLDLPNRRLSIESWSSKSSRPPARRKKI